MNFLSNILSSSKKKTWKILAQEIGGTFIDGGIFSPDSVVLNYRNTTITLDTKGGNNRYKGFIRILCPFLATNEFKFKISPENAFTHAGKVFGINDIEIGDKQFDNDLYLKSRQEDVLINLLDSEELKKCYLELANLLPLGSGIRISDTKHFFTLQDIPKNIFWLKVEEYNIENNLDLLKLYFKIFKITLDRLIEIGEAKEINLDISSFRTRLF
jgi:hypothetical protein